MMRTAKALSVEDASLLHQAVQGAAHSLQYFLVGHKPVTHLGLLLDKARKGLTLDLIIPFGQLTQTGVSLRYLKKLRTLGGRFFVARLSSEDWQRLKVSGRDILLVDNSVVWRPQTKAGDWFSSTDNLGFWRTRMQMLRELSVIPTGDFTSPEALERAVKMPLIFTAAAQMVASGGLTTLHWSAPRAEQVTITPRPGRVSHVGSHKVRVEEATEFTLEVTAAEAVVAKVLNVGVSRELTLCYRVIVIDHELGGRQCLLEERDGLPGRYGLLAGQEVLLHWTATNAKRVYLNDQAVALTGEVRLRPSGVAAVTLTANGDANSRLEHKILLKTFTAPEVVPPPTQAPPGLKPQELPDIGALDLVSGFTTDPEEVLASLPADTRKELVEKWAEQQNGKRWISRLRSWWKQA